MSGVPVPGIHADRPGRMHSLLILPNQILMTRSPSPYLATDFRRVDASGDPAAFSRCLDTIDSIPFFQSVKEVSYRILAASGPRIVLDAGCGNGDELVRLAGILPSPCSISGIDLSASLLAEARWRTREVRDRCPLARGDLTGIPYRDTVFDAVLIHRVLQHIRNPAPCIRELYRVMRPGGILVAFDNDWSTFRISLDDSRMAQQICRFWCASFASGRIGRDFPGILKHEGFREIHAEPRVLTLEDCAVAEKVFDIPALLSRMAAAGEITREDAVSVLDEIRRRSENHSFSSGYTGYLVHCRKPL
jgi:ubiquinone/menaquinone biosynthesis C-methylase UbiE